MATNDAEVRKIGESGKLGRYVVLEDVYGNRYTYSGLGEVARHYPVPKGDIDPKLARSPAARTRRRRGPHPPAVSPTRAAPLRRRRPPCR